MKKNKVTIGTKSVIRIDNNLIKLREMNLFQKKFEESTAILLRAKLSFK